MRSLNWAILLIVAAALAWTALPRYVGGGLRPDLLLILVVFTALSAPPEDALAFSWFAGFVKDLLTVGPLGEYALLYLLLAAALLRVKTMFDTRVALSRLVIGAAAHFLCEGTYAVTEGLRTGFWPDAATRNLLLGSAVVTGALTPLLCRPLDRIGGWLGLERRRAGWVR
jgi:rod shape-determining protein MreD